MRSPVSSIITRCFNKKRLNILTCPTHERYQSGLDLVDANFWMWRGPGIKDWNNNYGAIPKNHFLLPYCVNNNISYEALNGNTLPVGIDFDLVLSQNKFGQYQVLRIISDLLHIPIIHLEHTLPYPAWSTGKMNELYNMSANETVFISDYSRNKWGYSEKDSIVIEHCVDTDLFKYDGGHRQNVVLTVVNDYINRDYCCGYGIYKVATKDIPTRPVGDTPGFSKPANTIFELVNSYNTSSIFLNTSTVSPIPTALLEAAACECACVSTSNCLIPDIFTHNHDALLTNNPLEMKKYLKYLLKNPKDRIRLGKNARQTVLDRFGKSRFTKQWNDLFFKMKDVVKV